MTSLLSGSVALFAASAAHATLVVAPTTNANDLASAILGPGISIVGTPTLISEPNQSGGFSGGTSAGLGFDTGILLTSGDATLAPGPNSSDGAAAGLGTAGDSMLDALIPQTTNDAAVLEFEFQFGDGSAGGDLFFTFIFASEEYNEFVDSSFNDPFGLFIDGVNVAIAPDGNPVTINNVNCGNPFAGAGPNCSVFNNNDPSSGTPAFDIEYDGFTDVLTAEALGLGAGTHTAKFAIADAGDSTLDSGVFIGGSSFTDEPPSIPVPATALLFGAGLIGLGLARRRVSQNRA